MPATGPLVARVAPDVSGLDKHFDYLVPDTLRDQVRVGTLVRIPLHGRRVGGWVVGLGESSIEPERLKPIAKVTGHGPSADLVDLAGWAAHRWAGPLRAVLTSASPPRATRAVPSPRHRAADRLEPAEVGDPDVRSLLTGPELGGVIRLAPAATVVPVITAAAALGPTLVIVPAVERAGLAAARLRRLGLSVAVMPGEWAAAAGGVDITVGARGAAWASVPGLRSIVVLDEHDEALQEERSPTWHARDVCLERARRLGIPCLLVSSVPSLAAVEAFGGRVVAPSRLTERAGWPRVEVVDLGDDDPWVTSLVTSPLITELRDHDRRVVCVHNTTGRARRLACKACRELAVCERCRAPVSEPVAGTLHCARCGLDRPRVCQACGAARLVVLRPGVSRLREELEAAAGRPVVEVTASLRADEPVPAGDVYIGTEAVLHRVRRADTVAFLDLDAELLAPRYRAGEQALALVARAARLVGGRDTGGRLLLQTYLPDHDVIDAARFADPARGVEAWRPLRQALGFPPFGALAAVSGAGAEAYVDGLRAHPELTVMGPAEERYLVRAATPDLLADALAATPRPADRLRVVVDPPRV